VTVWRWLSEEAIKPWQHRSWIFPRDPHFTPKADRILDLYSRRWEGELRPKDGIVPFDALVEQFRASSPTARPDACS